MKKERIDELFEELYEDKNKTMLNLFCASLISSDSITTEPDCLKKLDLLQAFKLFIQKQPSSEKQDKMLLFIKTAESVLKKDLELYR